jgi:DNA-binding beta-propeller fold protein YncE
MMSRSNLLKTVAVLLFGLLISVTARAADPVPKRTLLALSKADHTLSVVDPATLKIISHAPVGPDPHEVIASSDGATAYVSNTGSGRFHEINVIDLNTTKALPNIDTGALLGPHGLTFVGGKLWFTAEGAKAVGRYDPASSKFDWIMGTGQNRTHMIYVTPDEKHVYTTNVASSTVSIFDYVTVPPTVTPMGTIPPGAKPHDEWLQTVISVGKGAEGFDVSPDGRELWTASAQDGLLSVIDIPSRKMTSIDAHVTGANRLKFTPDGKKVLISSLRSGELVVYDVESRKEAKRIKIGGGDAGILVDSENARAFISCYADNYLAVLDLKTLEVTNKIEVGKPDGLAWAVRP